MEPTTDLDLETVSQLLRDKINYPEFNAWLQKKLLRRFKPEKPNALSSVEKAK